jgi:uncharacterized protein DUF885
MKVFLVISLIALNLSIGFGQDHDLGSEYIEKWKNFYPSQALRRGIHSAIFQYENLALNKVESWLNYNKDIKRQLLDTNLKYVQENEIDTRLLKVQVQSEIDKWEKEAPHMTSLSLYSNLISGAVSRVLAADFLTIPEKAQIICQRLSALEQLSTAAISSLRTVDKDDLDRSLRRLNSAKSFFQDELPDLTKDWSLCDDFKSRYALAVQSIQSLIDFANNNLMQDATASTPILGSEEYARRLALYTDSDLTPEVLSEMALKEINEVKLLMKDVAEEFLKSAYPNMSLAINNEALIRLALAAMEKDAPINAADYLAFWQGLAKDAVDFIAEHKIATLPENQTLDIITAPESAGPAARIGWVASAPPFDPNPLTTLNLPSIPETVPMQEQIDFWASFNKPFNRMIVIHELLPGHYMQMKISRESPHPIRLLFPFGIYTEGWATFCEKVLLDAGWEEGNHLTMLAHLRKRLENANRTYTSVQVHTQGWTQEQVMEFSTKTSMVAPQFAKSLWGRLMSSPIQLTSYFLGGAQFTALLAAEKTRLGDQFNLTFFMDTIMKSGPIPIEEFHEIFSQSISKKD